MFTPSEQKRVFTFHGVVPHLKERGGGGKEARCSNFDLNTKESVHPSEFLMKSLNSFLMGPVSWMISELSI